MTWAKRFFYIYDWPKELDDVYPSPESQLAPDAAYSHAFYANDGYGECVDACVDVFSVSCVLDDIVMIGFRSTGGWRSWIIQHLAILSVQGVDVSPSYE